MSTRLFSWQSVMRTKKYPQRQNPLLANLAHLALLDVNAQPEEPELKEEELDRAKADLKSRLIMQSESSSSRASGLVNDWWSLGRLRKLDEVKQAINTVSSEDIVRFSNNFPAGPITLVTLGSKRLELN